MYSLILILHNWVRWLVVLFGLYAVVRAYVGLFDGAPGRRPTRRPAHSSRSPSTCSS